MSPVQKAQGAAAELGISPHLDPILVKKLNEQNVWEVLSSSLDVNRQDIMDHLKFKHAQLEDLIQNFKTMSMFAEANECLPKITAHMNADAQLSQQELEAFAKALVAAQQQTAAGEGKKFAGGGKMAAGGGKTAEGGEKSTSAPLLGEEVAQAEALLDEYEAFWADFQETIFNVQLQGELEAKNQELEAEVQRIIAMVRSGKIDAVWLLIALAKVNVSKNGLIFTHLGKKYKRMNDQANRAVEELFKMDTNNPQYYAYLQMTSQKQKEIGTNQQFMIQDMQKITQNIEQVMSFAKSAIDEIFKTRLHMINAPFRSM